MPQKIKLIAIGKLKDRNISSQIAEFEKRMSPLYKLETIELKDEGLEKEAIKLEKYIGPSTYVLDERGREYTSEQFAQLLKTGGNLEFIIGGPDGITPPLKAKANLISLSKLTFTHELARLLLVEQLYRAFMINSGRGYYQK